jgi:hypothetical protein
MDKNEGINLIVRRFKGKGPRKLFGQFWTLNIA